MDPISCPNIFWHFIPLCSGEADVIWPRWSLGAQTAVNFGQLKLVFCRKLSPLKQTKASQGHKQDFQIYRSFLGSELDIKIARHWRGASSKSPIRIHKNFKWFQSTTSSSLCQRVVSWKKVNLRLKRFICKFMSNEVDFWFNNQSEAAQCRVVRSWSLPCRVDCLH